MSREGAVSAYTAFHWGEEPSQIRRIRDTLVPDCAQIGELRELHVVGNDGRAGVLHLPADCHVAFDPKHPAERIHLILCPEYRDEVKQLVAGALQGGGAELEQLQAVAERAGGRQGEHAYPRVRVVDLGEVTHVLYRTTKRGDGLSDYIHEFGEESGITPRLAADTSGRLWLAGGNYTCPNEGITD